MEKALTIILACFLLQIGNVYAQNTSSSKDSASHEAQKNKTSTKNKNSESTSSFEKNRSEGAGNNDGDFRDDSTDAAVGMSGLSTTPGVSTTTGAGGLGTNENAGHNTSSDIYNMERKDSIRKALENKGESQHKKSKKDPPE